MEIAGYQLEQEIRPFDSGLREFSALEYRSIGSNIKGEKIFHAGTVEYHGISFDCVLGVLNNKLYKVALTVDLHGTPRLRNTLITEFGRPSEEKGDSVCVWDKEWGNIVYTVQSKTRHSVFFTSKRLVTQPATEDATDQKKTSGFASKVFRYLFFFYLGAALYSVLSSAWLYLAIWIVSLIFLGIIIWGSPPSYIHYRTNRTGILIGADLIAILWLGLGWSWYFAVPLGLFAMPLSSAIMKFGLGE